MKNELKKRILSSIIIIPISIFFITQESILFLFFLGLLFLITSYEWININKKNNLIKFLGIVCLLLSFNSAYYFRKSFGIDFFIFTILICVFADIGGYTFGKIFGGPKLIKKISPKKTYTGMIGSFLLPLIIGLIFINYFLEEKIIFSSYKLFAYILLISLVNQIGDLIISYFKRKAKLKDTGKILPGHGGLLDRIDGLIFVIPSIYILMLVLKWKKK